MRVALQVCGYVVGLPLELLIIATLLRGGYKRFPFLFLYTVADFLTSVVEIRPSLNYGSRSRQAVREWAFIYWMDERIMQTLMFLLVISLIYAATANMRPRRLVLALLIFGTLAFAGVSLAIHYNPQVVPGKWMTPWTRDLSFCAALLDLGLWTLLIRPGKRNRQLLMITGGLGILFTGQAIGQAVRNIGQSLQNPSSAIVLLGGLVIVATNVVCLYIWWRTLRAAPERLTRMGPAGAAQGNGL
jgi:hypothetical protein